MALTLQQKFQNVFGEAAAPALDAIAIEEIELQNDNRASVFQMLPMSKEITQWEKISGLARFQQTAEGTQAPSDKSIEAGLKTYTALKFALEIGITEEMIDDARGDMIERMIRALARSGVETQLFNAWNAYNNAFSSELAYDGISLLSDNHSVIAGTSDNLLAAQDLDVTPLKNANTTMRKFTDERNKRLNIQPRTLIVPVDEEHNAAELVESPFLPGGANNNINSITRYDVVSSPYLTDADAWFLQVDPSSPAHGAKIYERMPLTRRIHEDERAGVIYYVSKYRQAIGFDEWRGIVGSQGAG